MQSGLCIPHLLFCLFLVLAFSVASGTALSETRVLLAACREFSTMPDLGDSASGNLSLLRNTFVHSGIPEDSIRVEDGTLDSVSALQASLDASFSQAADGDLSIFYLCTHGLGQEGDVPAHLILSDGTTEANLDADTLMDLLAPIQGNVLLVLDACYSGAFIGHGTDDAPRPLPANLHVMTSSLGTESAWYYAHQQVSKGAVSFFSEAICSGLGLYGHLDADTDGDDNVSLRELALWVKRTVASSTCQIASAAPDTLLVPCCTSGALSKPVAGFSCGSQLISSTNTAFHFSFNVTRDALIEYRLIPYEDDHWNWAEPIVIPDSESPEATGRGGKTRTLSIAPANRENSGYLIFQMFASDENGMPQLCAERLLAIQSENDGDPDFDLNLPPSPLHPDENLTIRLDLSAPSIFRISIYDDSGVEIRRLYYGELTRPSKENIQYLSWDMLDETGLPLQPGTYTIEAMALFFGKRIEKVYSVTVR